MLLKHLGSRICFFLVASQRWWIYLLRFYLRNVHYYEMKYVCRKRNIFASIHQNICYHTDNITCLSSKFETPHQPYSQQILSDNFNTSGKRLHVETAKTKIYRTKFHKFSVETELVNSQMWLGLTWQTNWQLIMAKGGFACLFMRA